MSEQVGPTGTTGPAAAPADGRTGAGRSRWTWLVPALAFLAGVVLTAVVLGAGALGGDGTDETASPGATPTPEASSQDELDADAEPAASKGALVRVPASCVQAADSAEATAREVDDVVDAARALDARRLQELVDRFQQQQPELRRLADECRAAAGDRLVEGSLVTPAPTPTP